MYNYVVSWLAIKVRLHFTIIKNLNDEKELKESMH